MRTTPLHGRFVVIIAAICGLPASSHAQRRQTATVAYHAAPSASGVAATDSSVNDRPRKRARFVAALAGTVVGGGLFALAGVLASDDPSDPERNAGAAIGGA